MNSRQSAVRAAGRLISFGLIALSVVTSSVSHAADESKPAGASACEVSGRTSGLVLLSCPRGLDREALADAGRKACADKTTTACNVWIWDNPSAIPKEVPQTDADLPKESRARAVGVWVDDVQQLLILKKVR